MVGNGKGLVGTIKSSNTGFTTSEFEFGSVEIGAAFDNIGVGGAKTFATRKKINSFEDRGFTATVGAQNERTFVGTLKSISRVIAKISKFEGFDNHMNSA